MIMARNYLSLELSAQADRSLGAAGQVLEAAPAEGMSCSEL